MFNKHDNGYPVDQWINLFPSPIHHDPKWNTIRAARENSSLLQRMSKWHSLEIHRGCVNTISWDETGQYLLSGSDDHRLIITEPHSKKIYIDVHSSHRANIFSAKFLPVSNIRKIVSCAGDGNILYTDLARIGDTHNNNFTCHSGTTYELQTVQNDPNSFLSCGEDGTVRSFDLRTKDKCRKSDCKEDILINLPYAVTSMSMHPFLPYYLAVGSSDACVRLFDRRMLSSNPARCKLGLVSRFSVPEMSGKKRRITAVDYRPDGQEILVSYSSDYIYIFDPNDDDESRMTKLCVGARPSCQTNESLSKKPEQSPPPPMKRLRLRGDWSDTGPNARPDTGQAPPSGQTDQESQAEVSEQNVSDESSQNAHPDRPRPTGQVNNNLMQRMTDALSRMLNDPNTRQALRTITESRENAATESQGTAQDAQDQSAPQADDESNNHQESETDAQVESSNLSETTESSLEATNAGGSNRGRSAMGRTIDDIQDSISTLREEFVERHNTEPEVNLRYSAQGMESSSISIDRSTPTNVTESQGTDQDDQDQSANVDDDDANDNVALPGPRQLMTDPGVPSTNPITGARQRRRGVSGPSSEPLAMSTPQPSKSESEENSHAAVFSDDDCCEYEADDHEEDSDEQFVRQPRSKQKFIGHRNARTMIKEATWWGSNYILSGSDCGHIFGWDRHTGKLVLLLEADRHVVNCIQPHPFEPLIASSGIDYDVKIWTPSGSGNTEPIFDENRAAELTKMNEIMLEETRDTITVPATLMIRMLASLNQIRRVGRLIPRVMERRREREIQEASNNATEEENAEGGQNEESNQTDETERNQE